MKILMIVFFVLCLVCLIWTIHCSVTYYQFSKNIKNWALELDDAMLQAVDNAARRILMEMDERITAAKNAENEINNNIEIIDEENEKDVFNTQS